MTTSGSSSSLLLDSLSDNIPAIPQETAVYYKYACMVCLDNQNHKPGVVLEVAHGRNKDSFEIHWQDEVTPQLLRAYADLTKTTEVAACALALLLVRELTDFTAIEQATRGTTVDYYLIRKTQDATFIFNHAARLEASGILQEDHSNTVDSRIKSKLDRLKPDPRLPTLIVVVEFSNPWSKMVQA